MTRSLFGVLLVLTLTADASAQQAPPAQPAGFVTWDIEGGVGWLNRSDLNWRTRIPAEIQSSASVDAYRIGLGRYWTTHLKTEASVSMVPREFGSSDVQTIPVAGLPGGGDIYTAKRSTLTQMLLAGTYQFRDNAFVHPFLTGGLQVDWLRVHRFRDERAYTQSNGVFIVRYRALALDEHYVETLVSAVGGGGAKVYFNRRIFVRPEALVALGGAITQVTLLLGVGVDF